MYNFICCCNNCNTTLIDTNPQIGAKKIYTQDDTLSLIHITDDVSMEVFWVCPICLTDDFLMDIEELK